jgi:hypothetical protein
MTYMSGTPSSIISDHPARDELQHLFSGALGGLRIGWTPITSYQELHEASGLRCEYALHLIVKAIEFGFVNQENWRTAFSAQRDWTAFLEELGEREWWVNEREWNALNYLFALENAPEIHSFEQISDVWREELRRTA